MKNFIVFLQRLIDSEVKPSSIIGFCKELYDFKEAKFIFNNASSIAIKRKCIADYNKQYEYIKDWLRVFNLEDTYKPEDFLDDLI